MFQVVVVLLTLIPINISQGSVATRLRCGRIFYYSFITNFMRSLSVKNFENRSVFGQVRIKNIVAPFPGHDDHVASAIGLTIKSFFADRLIYIIQH